ncbi:hypothetical protein ACJX0J_011313, partial [Zea mays]
MEIAVKEGYDFCLLILVACLMREKLINEANDTYLKRIAEEERIMNMDVTILNEIQQQYYRQSSMTYYNIREIIIFLFSGFLEYTINFNFLDLGVWKHQLIHAPALWPSRRCCRMVLSISCSGTASSPARKALIGKVDISRSLSISLKITQVTPQPASSHEGFSMSMSMILGMYACQYLV